MIPHEVVCIAEELAEYHKGSKADWENFLNQAWSVYKRLQAEAEALHDACERHG